jgi:zinc transporter ZupT
VTNSEGSKK